MDPDDSYFLVKADGRNYQLLLTFIRSVSRIWMDLSSVNETWVHDFSDKELLVVGVIVAVVTPVSLDLLQVPNPHRAISRATYKVLAIEIPRQVMDQVSVATKSELKISIFAIKDLNDGLVISVTFRLWLC